MPSHAQRAEFPPQSNSRADYWVAGALLTISGISALWFFYSRNEILLSGDAVAHINIARHVFDSRTPGLLQLGSVWLPLPHLLMIPFVANDRLWQSGIGGSILSLVSYIVAGLGVFRLLFIWSRSAAWIGMLVFAANPNLLYVESTALNEPLYLAAFLWATVCFVEASRRWQSDNVDAARWLQRGAVALTLAVFTRYDGWFLACICWLSLSPWLLKTLRENPTRQFRRALLKALLLTALGPALWFAYNLGVYGNPLEFANGPYSAKAIAQRTTKPGAPPYPGKDHPFTAATYFVKTAQLDLAEGRFGKALLLLAILGTAVMLARGSWQIIVLLWSPLIFYAISIAYGSVPIFIPVWWPFSYYNTRYGLELLPAIAAGAGFSVFAVEAVWNNARVFATVTTLVMAVTAASYVKAALQVPICLREMRVNGFARMEIDGRVAGLLQSLPRNSTVLAYTGSHSGAFEMADFPIRQSINEGNMYIWDAALALPAMYADYVIACDGDPVADAVRHHPGYLQRLSTFDVSGQPRIVVYKSELRPPHSGQMQRTALIPRRGSARE